MSTVKKRYIYLGLGFLLAFILQTTVLKHIAVFGYSPNLVLCMVVVCSFLYDEKIGLVYGIVFGLLLDFTANIYVGPSAIAFILVYLFVIAIRKIFNHEHLLPELLLAGVSTPLYLFVMWFLYLIGGSPVSIIVVLKALPVLLIYNGIVIVLLHLLLVKGVIKHRKDTGFTGGYKYRGGYRA